MTGLVIRGMSLRHWICVFAILAPAFLIEGLASAQQMCSCSSTRNGAANGDGNVAMLSMPFVPQAPTIQLSPVGAQWQPPLSGTTSEVEVLTLPGGTVSPASGQFTQNVGLCDLPQITPYADLPFFLWYGSHSIYEAAAEYPLWPRTHGFHWRAPWDECLYDPSPGSEVLWICTYGLAAHTTVDGYRTIEIETREKLRSPFTEYYYVPFADGTRLVYEYHGGGGVWFREFADGHRIEYESTTNQYTPSGAQDPVAQQRIARIYRGDYDSPDWEIVYDWNGSDQLEKITDTRGVEYDYQWSGNPARVAAIVVSRPAVQGAPTYRTGFQYDGSGRLLRVIQPKRPFLYDRNHDQAYQEQSEGLDECPAIGFAYEVVVHGTSYDRIVTTYRESWTWNGSQYGGSATYQETALSIAYGSTSADWWRVDGQTEWIGTGDARSHAFDYFPTGYPYPATRWTDPLGVQHVYEYENWPGIQGWEGQPVLKRKIRRMTKIPRSSGDPRPDSDPAYVGPLAWKFSWDRMRITTIQGPYPVTAAGQDPQTDPLTVIYSYDNAKRGLVLQVQVEEEGVGTQNITRSWTYENWGAPWDSATAKRKASRMASYTDARGQTWTFSFNENTLETTVTHPSAGGGAPQMTHVVEEDVLGRVIKTTEPEFSATVTSSNTSSVSSGMVDGLVEYGYGIVATSPSYGFLTSIRQYQGLSHGDSVDTLFEYSGVGLLEKATIANGDNEEREFGFTYDGAMKRRYIYMPDPSTGSIPATPSDTNWAIAFRNDPLGQVACTRRRALQTNGSAYTKNFIETWQWFDYVGRPIKKQVDRAPMSQSGSDPLVTKIEWDVIDRLSAVRGPIYQSAAVSETEYTYDDHSKPYHVSRRLTGNPDTWATRYYGFTKFGTLRLTKDATDYAVQYDSDTYGRVYQALYIGASTLSPGNRMVELTLDPEGDVYQSVYRYNSTLQSTATYTRDNLGRIINIVTENGSQTTISNWEYGYNGLVHIATVREKICETPLGERGRNYAYDPLGRMVSVEDTLSSNHGNRVQVVRNPAGDIIERWSRRMREASWGTIDHTWNRTNYVWNFRSELTEVQRFRDQNNVVAKQQYAIDQLGRVVGILDRQLNEAGTAWLDWTSKSWAYDALGRPLTETISPKSGGAENPVELEFAYTDIPLDGGSIHGEWGFVLTRTDGRDNTTSFHYDRAGRLIGRRLPGFSAPNTAFGWDYTYDAEGRLIYWVDGNGAAVTLKYYDDTKLLEYRKAHSNFSHLSNMTTWENWTYDPAFLRVSGARTRFSTFQDSNAPTLVNATASWDTIGRIQTEGYQWLGLNNPTPATVTSSWDVGGGILDPVHRQKITTASGWELKYNHDNGGRLSSMQIKAPNAGAFSELARWRYEGSAVLGRKTFTTTGTQNYLEGVLAYDGLGQLTSIATAWTSGGATLLADSMKRDWLGNVIWRKYLRCSGGDGDWWSLDGFDRLIGAKIGVPTADFTNETYSTASYEKKIDYVLDPAHNRNQVTVTPSGGGGQVTSYTVDANSNRYTMVGNQNYVYDGNGNLVFDGQYMYKYDYLDRLCEVYLYEPSEDAKRVATPPSLSLRDVRSLLLKAAQANAYLFPINGPIPKNTKIYRDVQPTTATDSVELLAYYGYDPYGRRIGELVAGEDIEWTAWDGWRRTDVYKHDAYSIFRYKALFDGEGIDEHLGYAIWDPNEETWERYTYLQGWLGHIEGVVDTSGTVVERYEYNPYGARTIYDGGGANQRIATAVHNDYGYTGRKHEKFADLVYYRYRHYHSGIGRFITEDPAGNWHDAGEWGNGYAYGASAPTINRDPIGLSIFDDIVGGLESAANWSGGAVTDAVNWSGGAVADAVNWSGGAVADAVNWSGGALETVGEFISENGEAGVKLIRNEGVKIEVGIRKKVNVLGARGELKISGSTAVPSEASESHFNVALGFEFGPTHTPREPAPITTPPSSKTKKPPFDPIAYIKRQVRRLLDPNTWEGWLQRALDSEFKLPITEEIPPWPTPPFADPKPEPIKGKVRDAIKFVAELLGIDSSRCIRKINRRDL